MEDLKVGLQRLIHEIDINMPQTPHDESHIYKMQAYIDAKIAAHKLSAHKIAQERRKSNLMRATAITACVVFPVLLLQCALTYIAK